LPCAEKITNAKRPRAWQAARAGNEMNFFRTNDYEYKHSECQRCTSEKRSLVCTEKKLAGFAPSHNPQRRLYMRQENRMRQSWEAPLVYSRRFRAWRKFGHHKPGTYPQGLETPP